MDGLAELAKNLGIGFKDPRLLKKALTHRSWSNESGQEANNERLEFLGDAVLGFVITEYLYAEYPDQDEGVLTRLKSVLVSEKTLAGAAQRLNLGEALIFGRGEKVSGGSTRPSNLANAFEALLGAIYLDQGIEEVRKFILLQLASNIELGLAAEKDFSPRSELQEYVQKRWHSFPVYKLVSQSKPDKNNQSQFVIEVYVNDECWGRGVGFSKKEASRQAALQGLEKIEKKVSG